MKSFMDQDFLLQTKTASELFHKYAEKAPILDYHCHISPAQIADNHRFDNITQVWLGGDHYKWRFMRSCGVEEAFITGDASDQEKFYQWAACVGKAIGNPLYHSGILATRARSTRTPPGKYGRSAMQSSERMVCARAV